MGCKSPITLLVFAEVLGKHGPGPVFLCHGTPSSRLNRPDDESTRALGVRLIAIDRPGCGLSDFLPGRTLLDWPTDLAAVADALGIGRFAVVGFSGGGPYVAASAFALPDRGAHGVDDDGFADCHRRPNYLTRVSVL